MEHRSDGANSYFGQLLTDIFRWGEIFGILHFGFSGETGELIDRPRHKVQLIIFCTFYVSAIYYDLTSGESISVAGAKSSLFNYGMSFVSILAFAFSLCSALFTYILRKQIVKLLSTLAVVEKNVRATAAATT